MRPLLKTENAKGGRKVGDIMRVINGKVVVVLDPDESKARGKGHKHDTLSTTSRVAWQLSYMLSAFAWVWDALLT